MTTEQFAAMVLRVGALMDYIEQEGCSEHASRPSAEVARCAWQDMPILIDMARASVES